MEITVYKPGSYCFEPLISIKHIEIGDIFDVLSPLAQQSATEVGNS